MKRIVIAVLALLSATFVFSQQPDVEGSKDHPLISRYPGSVITEYSAVEFDEYTLPLGKIEEGSRFAKSQHLEGKVTRIHYDSPEHRSGLEVTHNYQQALERAGFQTLFSCSGDEQCGGGTVGNGGWCGGCSPRQLTAKLSRAEGDVYVSFHIEQDNPSTLPEFNWT